MAIPILRIRGTDGQMHGIPALRGEKGDPYTLTEADKQTIVQAVLAALPSGDEVMY